MRGQRCRPERERAERAYFPSQGADAPGSPEPSAPGAPGTFPPWERQ